MQGHKSHHSFSIARRFVLAALAVLFLGGSTIRAQVPSPAAAEPVSHSPEGFVRGWGAGVLFEGSGSSDGVIYDLGAGVGYNFSSHFGVDLGAPFYFVNTPTSIKQTNQSALSGIGVGSIGANLKFLFPTPALNYGSTVHLTAPTGDVKKGLSTGHATWNWSNHFEHGFGSFTPYLDGGVGNTLLDTRFFHRPFTTFGYAAQFEAGTEIDAFGPFSLTVSAYDVLPVGTQTVVSKVFRCGQTCTKTSNSTNRRGYTLASIQTGTADLVRDNGFNAGIEVKPRPYLDLEFDYSRSVPLQLNTFSFGVAVDLHSLYKSSTRHKN